MENDPRLHMAALDVAKLPALQAEIAELKRQIQQHKAFFAIAQEEIDRLKGILIKQNFEIPALQIENEQLKAMTEWQPISSVPKIENKLIDLWVSWNDTAARWPDCHWTGAYWYSGELCYGAGDTFDESYTITHWRYPPKPPSE
jgi:hypothetical protein